MTDRSPASAPASTDVEAPTSSVFALWAVFRRDAQRPLAPADGDADGDAAERDAAELDRAVEAVAAKGVTVRGVYDVSGFKADTDLMIWMHGTDPQLLQAALRTIRRTRLFARLIPHGNFFAVHREAEFNKAHVPAFIQGKPAKEWICVYPFVRTHDWYLLRDAERGRMLAEHGRAGHAFTEVLANTMAAFALGDYEWIVPLESDELTDLVDLMRALRYVDARRHVTLETPFYTGRRVSLAEVAEVLR